LIARSYGRPYPCIRVNTCSYTWGNRDEAKEVFIFILCFCCFILITHFDCKRLVAFSTIYQICCSFFVCFFVDCILGFLYFCYHMFYKCLLFLLFGFLLHFFFGLQDYRYYVFNFVSFVLVFVLLFLVLYIACSLWFLFGFFFKDLVVFVFFTFYFFFVYHSFFYSVM